MKYARTGGHVVLMSAAPRRQGASAGWPSLSHRRAVSWSQLHAEEQAPGVGEIADGPQQAVFPDRSGPAAWRAKILQEAVARLVPP
jgi:hypothetical protein